MNATISNWSDRSAAQARLLRRTIRIDEIHLPPLTSVVSRDGLAPVGLPANLQHQFADILLNSKAITKPRLLDFEVKIEEFHFTT